VRQAKLLNPFAVLAFAALSLLLVVPAPARAEAPQSTTQKKRTTVSVRRPSRAVREAMTPRYKRDATGALVPDPRAEAAIIFNPESGRVVWEENAHDQRPIASITKVMTALVFLEDDPDLSAVVTVTRADVRRASTTYLRANEKLVVRDVLHLALIASDNAAARVLARISHGGTGPFVDRMNRKAVELGLEDTAFSDPSGLDADNVSSAYDLSRLITFAGHDERIATIMQKPEYQLKTSRRTLRVRSTNRLLGQLDVVSGKTGFIQKAGYCLATLLRMPQGLDVAVVVLGAHSNLARFWETRHLFNWLKDQSSLLASDSSSSH
jgi:D-alanyl-D-alanine endopeptidase (penicillin-binding protein 7)